MKNTTTKTLTRTAVLLALCVVVQQFKQIDQMITGPLVNAILILSVLFVGLWAGVTISVLSPIFAFILSASPILRAAPQMLVLIPLGNLSLIFLVWLFREKLLPVGLALGSLLKTVVLWGGVQFIILPFFAQGLKGKQPDMLKIMFSYNQLITAAIGSVLAFAVWILLKKVIKK